MTRPVPVISSNPRSSRSVTSYFLPGGLWLLRMIPQSPWSPHVLLPASSHTSPLSWAPGPAGGPRPAGAPQSTLASEGLGRGIPSLRHSGGTRTVPKAAVWTASSAWSCKRCRGFVNKKIYNFCTFFFTSFCQIKWFINVL